MPMIRVECPFCGFEGKANLKLVGFEVGCRECGERFEIPLVPVMSKSKEASGLWKPIEANIDIGALVELERSGRSVQQVDPQEQRRRQRKARVKAQPEPPQPVLPLPTVVKAPVSPFAPPSDPTRVEAQEGLPETAAPAIGRKRSKIPWLALLLLIVLAAAAGAAVWMMPQGSG